MCLKQNLNAARSCFLPQGEKDELIKQLESIYGLTYWWKELQL